MTDELARLVRYVYDATGRRRLGTEDFVRILSFERSWLSPRTVRAAVTAAAGRRLIEPAGEDEFELGFDAEGLRLGFAYAPDEKALEAALAESPTPEAHAAVPLFRRLVRRIASRTHQADAEVVAAVNRQQSTFGGLLTAEATALYYGRLQGVDVADFYPEVLARLVSPKGT